MNGLSGRGLKLCMAAWLQQSTAAYGGGFGVYAAMAAAPV